MNKNTLKIGFFTTVFLMAISLSCNPERSSNDHSEITQGQSGMNSSAQQDTANNIRTGTIKKDVIEEKIPAKGSIIVAPGSKASVNAPMDGFVKELRFNTGQYVRRGTVLAVLEHPSYIQLQQQFLKAKNELTFYKADFTRQGQLTVENAASVKTMQEAEVKYRTTEVDYLALQAQLRLLGLEPDSIHEDGIASTIVLKAPISGYISAINAAIGKFAQDHEALYELMDPDHMYLKLQMAADVIDKLQTGLPVHFRRANHAHNTYKAHVYTMAKNVDETTGHIDVHARFAENYDDLLPGMKVEAEIISVSDSVYVLPKNAVIHEGDATFAFYIKGNQFERVKLNTGRMDQEHIEVLNVPDTLRSYEFVKDGASGLNHINTQDKQ